MVLGSAGSSIARACAWKVRNASSASGFERISASAFSFDFIDNVKPSAPTAVGIGLLAVGRAGLSCGAVRAFICALQKFRKRSLADQKIEVCSPASVVLAAQKRTTPNQLHGGSPSLQAAAVI
jgi:hypothetical protein